MNAPAARGSASAPPVRWWLVAVLGAVAAVFAGLAWGTTADPPEYLLALGLVALFTPLKALMIRWLDGRRPYQSAFAASMFSIFTGMWFEPPLNLWPLLLRSTLVTAALETLPLVAFRTSSRPVRVLLISTYMSLVVHLLSIGFLLIPRAPMMGIGLMVVGVAVLLTPLFLRVWALRRR